MKREREKEKEPAKEKEWGREEAERETNKKPFGFFSLKKRKMRRDINIIKE